MSEYFSEALKSMETPTSEAPPEAPAPEPPAAAEPPATEPAQAEPAAKEPVTEPEKPADAQPQAATETSELDTGEGIAPSKFAEFINSKPELKAAFDDPANSEVKNLVFAALRRDEENREFRRMGITDKETAQELIGTATRFHDFDNNFETVNDQAGAEKFWEKLWGDFAQRDDKGEVTGAHPAFMHLERAITEANVGTLVKLAQNGQYHPMLTGWVNQVLDALQKSANGNQDLMAGIEAVRDALPASSQPSDAEMPEHIKAAAERNRRDREAIDRQNRESAEQANKAAIDRVEMQVASSAIKQVEPLMQKAKLTPWERSQVVKEIGTQLGETLADESLPEMRLYQQRRANILRRPAGEARDKELLRLMVNTENSILGSIAKKVINQVTEGRMNRQNEIQQKRDANIQASRTEPRGATAGTPTPAKLTPAEVETQIRTDWAGKPENKGKDPGEMPRHLVFSEIMKRQRAGALSR